MPYGIRSTGQSIPYFAINRVAVSDSRRPSWLQEVGIQAAFHAFGREVMALHFLYDWGPFRIDALGLVTMIGAEEVDGAIGRLVSNPWTEYLPLLGSFIAAGNRFVQPIPGVTLYNITDGIKATDVSGWLSRWLNFQDPSWNNTIFIWGSQQVPWRERTVQFRALALGALLNGGLLTLTVLVGDWFGFANTAALITSVFVRWYMLRLNRAYLDEGATSMSGRGAEFVKVFCLLTDGKAVTLQAPRGLVVNGFLTTPRPYHKHGYKLCRAIGWVAFGIHVICIGQASLFIQIPTVVIMIAATVACVTGIGCDERHIGRRIHVYRASEEGVDDQRSLAYARLDLSDEEENSMVAWGLFPQRSNKAWWHKYQRLKESMKLEDNILRT